MQDPARAAAVLEQSLCTIRRVAEEQKQKVVPIPIDLRQSVDLEQMRQRAQIVGSLRKLAQDLAQALEHVGRLHAHCAAIHDGEICSMQAMISATGSAEAPETRIERPGAGPAPGGFAKLPAEELPPRPARGPGWPQMFLDFAQPRVQVLEVSDGLKAPVMVLPAQLNSPHEVLEAIRGPMLCYVPAWSQFAVRIGALLLHGNVGRIFGSGEARPPGVKPCRQGKNCSNGSCKYYHDPSKAPRAGARERSVRNYMDSSFLYTPALNCRTHKSGRYGLRRFGSAGTLKADMLALSNTQAQCYFDQVAHDMLCAVLLSACRASS